MAKKFLAVLLSVLMLVEILPISVLSETYYSNIIEGEDYLTVTFQVPEGATCSANTVTQYLASGEPLVLPEAPTKEGAVFLGWFDAGGVFN